MTFGWQSALAVGAGGFLGAIGRFYIGSVVSKHFPHALPLATLGVNLIGSFLIGILIAIFMQFELPNHLKLFLITGFLGALTTYSTFAIETYFLFGSSMFYAFLNIFLNLVGSIGFAAIGYKIVVGFFR